MPSVSTGCQVTDLSYFSQVIGLWTLTHSGVNCFPQHQNTLESSIKDWASGGGTGYNHVPSPCSCVYDNVCRVCMCTPQGMYVQPQVFILTSQSPETGSL